MTRRTQICLLLIAFWLVVGTLYSAAAIHQRGALNLSANAGGQYPYLAYAKGMAEEGWFGHLGDRNRMPVYPALLSLSFDKNWDTFVARSAIFAIVSSIIIVVATGLIAYRALPVPAATALTLFAAVCVFAKYASFVQAELLYYGLFFIFWLLLCRMLTRPSLSLGILSGVVAALTYLTKASALPLLVCFLFLVALRIAVANFRERRDQPSLRKSAIAAAALLLTFLMVCSPYLWTNHQRFGRWFYNVNSTFFMWCDSWAQAGAFAEGQNIAERFPDLPATEIPTAANYLRTHSPSQILRRFFYGLATIGRTLWHERGTKYLILAAVFIVPMARDRLRWKQRTHQHVWPVAFSVLMFVGYTLIYAWYAPVAFGERFILSLFLPAMFSLLWLMTRTSETKPSSDHVSRAISYSTSIAWILAAGMLVELLLAVRATPTADPTFVTFYYNESRERERVGDLVEAEKGYHGVIKLDDQFPPAHQALGMIALQQGRFKHAVESLERAALLAPDSADILNSLGSALLQSGQTDRAISEFERAVEINPKLAVAWYNLGGCYAVTGARDKAIVAKKALDRLDPGLARKLEALIKGMP